MRVLEIFASLQGEGVNLGKPAVFVRLAGCPIRCAYCDTKYSWDFAAGVEMTVEEVVAKVASLGVRGHVVVTGGEPLIWQRRGLEELACALRGLGAVEVETSGVYPPTPELNSCVDYYDVSPKLSNAGVKAPFSPFYARSPKAWFKFVVRDAADVEEALQFAEVWGIPKERVLLMPMAQSAEEHGEVLRRIWDAAVRLGLRVTPRLHIAAWGNERGR
ncbi:Organic radical activating enzyme [Pyrobaculum oguniense TE7]|uniref:7-carboxy-7-deazaguanine synthase n=1 Tax=Pyrobaculum oguniense (strain DSM 13380 / JCM 10595 / TE7) TaxID=698757 RepID=H6Q8Q4_PYROT|nr:Organic radical activating enzyme [Pyrobaculum oguniense TE7]